MEVEQTIMPAVVAVYNVALNTAVALTGLACVGFYPFWR